MTVEQYVKGELVDLGYLSKDIFINRFNTLGAETSILQNEDNPFTLAIARYDDYVDFETICGEDIVSDSYLNIAVRGSGDINKDNEFLDTLFRQLHTIKGNGSDIIMVKVRKKFIPLLINERDIIGYYATITVKEKI